MIVMNDFKKEYIALKDDIDEAVESCLSSGWYILGKNVREFEINFAQYNGSKYCIGVGNGMEAIQIALMSLGIGGGDEVLTVSNSAVATVLAITNIGAKPVFVDIDEYYHMDINDLEKKITRKSKAILPVHLFGQIADIDRIQKIAKINNLYLIEDACQAHGAMYKNKKAGTFGQLGCFSFYPTKNLGGYGDGGAITTDSKELYERCLMLRNYGQKNRYIHEMKGLNSRLDELQAVILNVKLKLLDKFVMKRNEIALLYTSYLRDIKQIRVPKIRKSSVHSFHLYVIQTQKRDELKDFLKMYEIEAQIHYPIPIHKQECYKEYNAVSLPKTETYSDNILSLPIHPFIVKDDVKKISSVIHSFYKT